MPEDAAQGGASTGPGPSRPSADLPSAARLIDGWLSRVWVIVGAGSVLDIGRDADHWTPWLVLVLALAMSAPLWFPRVTRGA